MARFSGILSNVFIFLALAISVALAQGTGGSQKKAGTTTPAANPAASTASPDKGEALSPEVVHRIQTEIRSHYNIPPQIDISLSSPKPGATPGYDDLSITLSGGGKSSTHEFLLSRDRKTLAHLETYDISQDLMSKINVKDRPVKGNPEAKVVIVNFDDFQCPFCSRMHAELFENVFKDYASKIKVIYKDYPLIEIHPWAMHAAVDGNCLGAQNNQAYWDFADYIHENQKLVAGKSHTDAFQNLDNAAKDQGVKYKLDQDKLQACIKAQDESTVRASIVEGDKLGVDSTPTLFINGERFSGLIPEDQLRAVLNRALADSGQQPPAADAKK